jgi:periplasmic protein TonB
MSAFRPAILGISLVAHVGVVAVLLTFISVPRSFESEVPVTVSLDMLSAPASDAAPQDPLPEVKTSEPQELLATREPPPEPKREEPAPVPPAAEPPPIITSRVDAVKPLQEVRERKPKKQRVVEKEEEDDDEPEEKPKAKPKPKPQLDLARQRAEAEKRAEQRAARDAARRAANVAARDSRPAGPRVDPNARAAYLAGVAVRIRSAQFSPSGGDSGTVVVSFTISRSGGLAGRRVARSSGSSTLDSAALSIVARAEPFPPIPASAGVPAFSLTQTIRFR